MGGVIGWCPPPPPPPKALLLRLRLSSLSKSTMREQWAVREAGEVR